MCEKKFAFKFHTIGLDLHQWKDARFLEMDGGGRFDCRLEGLQLTEFEQAKGSYMLTEL